MAEIKRITLHPLKEDGTIDLNTNLYPKTLLDGVVNREGEEVEVALKEDIPTDYATKEELLNKQDILVSGENIKTINNQSILGSGNINIPRGLEIVTVTKEFEELTTQEIKDLLGKAFLYNENSGIYYPIENFGNMWRYANCDNRYISIITFSKTSEPFEEETWEFTDKTLYDLTSRPYLHDITIDGETFQVVCPVSRSFDEYPDRIQCYYVGYSSSLGGIAYLYYSGGTYYLNKADGAIYASANSITDTVTAV